MTWFMVFCFYDQKQKRTKKAKKDQKRTKKDQKRTFPWKQYKYFLSFYYIMDQKFTCECCNFTTSNKSKYNRHLQTKKHEKYSANIALFSNDIAFFSPNIAFSEKRTTPKKMYECKYCQKVLQHQSSLSRHIKYTCKDNKDEDLKN